MLKCWSHDGIWSRKKKESFNENLLKKVKEIVQDLGRQCILFRVIMLMILTLVR